jgi:hypothetical protein
VAIGVRPWLENFRIHKVFKGAHWLSGAHLGDKQVVEIFRKLTVLLKFIHTLRPARFVKLSQFGHDFFGAHGANLAKPWRPN